MVLLFVDVSGVSSFLELFVFRVEERFFFLRVNCEHNLSWQNAILAVDFVHHTHSGHLVKQVRVIFVLFCFWALDEH